MWFSSKKCSRWWCTLHNVINWFQNTWHCSKYPRICTLLYPWYILKFVPRFGLKIHASVCTFFYIFLRIKKMINWFWGWLKNLCPFMWLGNTLLYTDAALECESLSVWMRGRAELVRQYNTYIKNDFNCLFVFCIVYYLNFCLDFCYLLL